jgi:hypothetical protein
LWLRSIKAFALSIQEKFHPRLKAGDDKILLLEKIDRAFTRISNKNNSLGRFEIDLSLDQLIFEIYGARAFKGLNFDKHKSDFRFMVNALILDGAMVCNGHQAKITPKALEILSTARKNDKRDRRTARINKFVAAVTMIGAIATVVGVIVDAPNSDQLSDKGVIHTLIELLASK